MVIYKELRADIGKILRQLCQQKGVEIIEAEACPDHIHMLLSIPPKYSVSQIMGFLKGKSSLMIFATVLIVDDKGDDLMPEALLDHDQPA
jgi:putative transposase